MFLGNTGGNFIRQQTFRGSFGLNPGPGLWLMLLLLLLIWCLPLQLRDLLMPDEGRYAQIPQAMLATGDWLTPRLNDLKYFEKPPLQYWLSAIGFALFGQHDWVARLWPALCGLFSLFVTWHLALLLARQSGADTPAARRAGHWSVLILASTLWHGFYARGLTLDMMLSCWLLAALYCFIRAQAGVLPETSSPPTSSPPPARWMLGCWLALAAAVMTKGPVGLVLPGMALVLCLLWQHDGRLMRQVLRQMQWLRGMALFLLLVSPWFVLMARAHPEFTEYFFLHEHLARFSSTGHSRSGAWWYFIAMLVLAFFPWSVLLFDALRAPRRDDRAGTATAAIDGDLLLRIFVIATLLFFSLSSSKLPAYILPLIAPLAALAGVRLLRLQLFPAHLSWRFGLGTMLALLLCVGLMLVDGREPVSLTSRLALARLQDWLLLASVLMTVASVLAWWLVRRQRLAEALVCLAALSLLAGTLVMLGVQRLSEKYSSADLVQQLRHSLRDQAADNPIDPFDPAQPFYAVAGFDQTLPYYLGRAVTLVEQMDEMAFGAQQEPAKVIRERDAFLRRWAPGDFALVREQDWPALQRAGMQGRVLAQGGGRLIVQRPAP